MTYSETLDWLFAQLPMYQRVGKAAYKADLDNTVALSRYLGNPENKFKSVHVAGTNGKGSSSHMLASIFQEAGYKVGLYTSPHLKDFRERIKINGKMIPKRTVTNFIGNHKSYFETNELSFFEMTVGMAFDYFGRKKVDIAIVEVGLGGRLDSTNIITPEISLITNIGLDHTQFLGNTLELIAKEKAGIIKPGVPVIVGETTSETKPVFESIAKENNSELIFAEPKPETDFELDLRGNYQQKNKATVLAAVKALQELDWHISEENIKNGLKNVVKNTGILGRWQQIGERPKIICDTAHNLEGLALVMDQLQNENYQELHIVLGMVSDKDLDRVLPLFPKNARYYFCAPAIARALPADELQRSASNYELKGFAYELVETAFKDAKKNTDVNDLIFVGGSTFVVAEVL
ncbi:MAG: bifunctional folylpolyglutamate synthase/dihydrofolate synthase [Flavobacteriaceae bacterium]|nr:bifunctional folylpolyglutamate synthase/dihydrofolate synthase [Flavobacteriaceae bacterium]